MPPRAARDRRKVAKGKRVKGVRKTIRHRQGRHNTNASNIEPLDDRAPHTNEREQPLSLDVKNRKRPQNSEDSNADRSPKRPRTEPVHQDKRRRKPSDAEGSVIDSHCSQKRPHVQSANSVGQNSFDQRVTGRTRTSERSLIDHWLHNEPLPPEWFKVDIMDLLKPKKKSIASQSSRKRSVSSIASALPDEPREEKSAPYKNADYELELASKGCYMKEHPLGISEESQELCDRLLDNPQTVPDRTLFGDDFFVRTCEELQSRNEAKILKDATPLIVPSAQPLAILGAKHLDKTIESVNEGWNKCFPITATRPQPDYAVGLRLSAFSSEQQAKIQAYMGPNSSYQSVFAVTYYMLFPFLTCEVKCGSVGLAIADRQNAHSMTVAARAIALLYNAIGAKKEIEREILTFSISHDDKAVQLYGHYVVFNKDQIPEFYRHPVRRFFFTDVRDKWAAYRFTKNVYDIFLPKHVERISSAIDKLPEWSLPGPTASSDSCSFQDMGSQGLEPQESSHRAESQSAILQVATPNTGEDGYGSKRFRS